MPPLTAAQKFMLITKDTFDPVTFAFIGLEAGLNQAAPRTLSNNINIWGTQIAWDAFSDELKEFWPDLHRLLVRHRH